MLDLLRQLALPILFTGLARYSLVEPDAESQERPTSTDYRDIQNHASLSKCWIVLAVFIGVSTYNSYSFERKATTLKLALVSTAVSAVGLVLPEDCLDVVCCPLPTSLSCSLIIGLLGYGCIQMRQLPSLPTVVVPPIGPFGGGPSGGGAPLPRPLVYDRTEYAFAVFLGVITYSIVSCVHKATSLFVAFVSTAVSAAVFVLPEDFLDDVCVPLAYTLRGLIFMGLICYGVVQVRLTCYGVCYGVSHGVCYGVCYGVGYGVVQVRLTCYGFCYSYDAEDGIDLFQQHDGSVRLPALDEETAYRRQIRAQTQKEICHSKSAFSGIVKGKEAKE
jgi:hypothetical protein